MLQSTRTWYPLPTILLPYFKPGRGEGSTQRGDSSSLGDRVCVCVFWCASSTLQRARLSRVSEDRTRVGVNGVSRCPVKNHVAVVGVVRKDGGFVRGASGPVLIQIHVDGAARSQGGVSPCPPLHLATFCTMALQQWCGAAATGGRKPISSRAAPFSACPP